MLSPITADLIDTYQQQGVIYLPQLLTKQHMATLAAVVAENLRRLSWRAKVTSLPTDPGLFVEDFCTWQQNASYREIIFASPLGEIAGLLMESQRVRLFTIICWLRKRILSSKRHGIKISLITT